MPSNIEARLAELGITLPQAPAPAANYVPFVQIDNIVYISGQVSMADGTLTTGKLGADMSVADRCRRRQNLRHRPAGASQSSLRRRPWQTGSGHQTHRICEFPPPISATSPR